MVRLMSKRTSRYIQVHLEKAADVQLLLHSVHDAVLQHPFTFVLATCEEQVAQEGLFEQLSTFERALEE